MFETSMSRDVSATLTTIATTIASPPSDGRLGYLHYDDKSTIAFLTGSDRRQIVVLLSRFNGDLSRAVRFVNDYLENRRITWIGDLYFSGPRTFAIYTTNNDIDLVKYYKIGDELSLITL